MNINEEELAILRFIHEASPGGADEVDLYSNEDQAILSSLEVKGLVIVANKEPSRRYYLSRKGAEAISAPRQPPPPAEKMVGIVPPHCAGYSFVFEPGVLHIKKDGSGHIVVNEEDFILEDDRCEGPDGPEGSVHWIVRLDASEIIALRDFLNGNTTADRLADKIEDLIAEFGDDPKAALECVSEHLSLRRHAIRTRAALASAEVEG